MPSFDVNGIGAQIKSCQSRPQSVTGRPFNLMALTGLPGHGVDHKSTIAIGPTTHTEFHMVVAGLLALTVAYMLYQRSRPGASRYM